MGFMQNIANAGIQEYQKQQLKLLKEQVEKQDRTIKLLEELVKILKK